MVSSGGCLRLCRTHAVAVVFPLCLSRAGIVLPFAYIRLTYITSEEARFGKIITYLTARWSVGGLLDEGEGMRTSGLKSSIGY